MAFLKDIILKPITGEWGDEGDEVKVLRTTNFTNSGVLNISNVVSRNISQKKVDQKKLLKGDIIIEKSGGSPTQPVGRVVFFDEDGVYLCNNFTSILRPKKDKAFPKYLHYLLFASHKFGVTSLFQNKTTGIINLQLPRYVDKLQIPLPPLKTQQHIAAILDDATALRDKTTKLLEEYDLLAQSIFLEMFGDPINPDSEFNRTSLKEITNISSGSTPSRQDENNFNGNIPWVKTGEVNSTVIIDTQEKISELGLKNSSCKLYEKGSIIIAMYGQGKTRGQVGMLGIPATTNQACAVLSPSKKMNFIYLYEYLKLVYDDLRSLGRGGNQPNLNAGLLKNYKVLNPPIPLQTQFAEKIALNEQQKDLAKQELQESEDLFNCLLQKAFKGELD